MVILSLYVVDLSKPLQSKIEIEAKERRQSKPFKYENISILCFFYEKVGHLEEACSHASGELKIGRKIDCLDLGSFLGF